ncbi:PEP-CTERM sorting domain-containing protein [Candidatus Uabimicrobium sp. HlEnr_7]|uniref:PEP-CTERM sorting domain-containing protein n=1 Tax=Candidatus Uabimicrobium helgolandensis TaxID=3095367 RepID=UPI0035573BC5
MKNILIFTTILMMGHFTTAEIIVTLRDRGDGGIFQSITGTDIINRDFSSNRFADVAINNGIINELISENVQDPGLNAIAIGTVRNETTSQIVNLIIDNNSIDSDGDNVGGDDLTFNFDDVFTASIGDVITFDAIHEYDPSDAAFVELNPDILDGTFALGGDFANFNSDILIISAVPEPSTYLVLFLLCALLVQKRQKLPKVKTK